MPSSARIFEDLHPTLTKQQAKTESDRCLFCFDAPCIQACPTGIDIPGFIRMITSGNSEGAAATILNDNILGGTCARACPTEVLCEDKCVMSAKGERSIEIGKLQRFAVDHHLDNPVAVYPFERQDNTGKRVAIVGAGPAGLSCSHKLSVLGHDVTLFDAAEKAGGLNEYGLAAYKMTNDFAQREVNYVLRIGGIRIVTNVHLGTDFHVSELSNDYDAVFLGIGLGDTRKVNLPGDSLPGICNAVDFIKSVRQSAPERPIEVADVVVVIGGGNTAVDAAIQAKRLGASEVHLVYRRGPEQMSATRWEQDLAAKEGVFVRHWLTPISFDGKNKVRAVTFADSRSPLSSGLTKIKTDSVMIAIGQLLREEDVTDVPTENGKIALTGIEQQFDNVFAGGDCVDSGDDLTVQAVEDGKQAALQIDTYLMQASQ